MPYGGAMRRRRRGRAARVAVAAMLAGNVAVGTGAAVLAVLLGVLASPERLRVRLCTERRGRDRAGAAGNRPAGRGDGVRRARTRAAAASARSGANLIQHPDSYAELGGYTLQTATAMGGLPYMTPLRITWGRRSAIAYKRDFGFGGAPIDGFPRVIDLWWELAESLGIPYESGMWSGPVRIERPPAVRARAICSGRASARRRRWSRRRISSRPPPAAPRVPTAFR